MYFKVIINSDDVGLFDLRYKEQCTSFGKFRYLQGTVDDKT